MKSLILFLLLSYTAAADIYPKPANKAHWAPPDAKMLTEMKPFVDRLNETTPPKYGLAVLPLFARGEFAAANARLLKIDTSRYDSDLWNGMEMMSIWMMYHDTLTPEAKSFIKKTMTAAIDGRGTIRTKGKSGMGGNKELSACVIRMLAGEQFDHRELAEKAQTIVDRMAADWSTRGSYSEYNSPTYHMIGFTSLMHHVTPELLKSSYSALKRNAAVGIDEMTWRDYQEDLDRRLLDLHERGMSCGRPEAGLVSTVDAWDMSRETGPSATGSTVFPLLSSTARVLNPCPIGLLSQHTLNNWTVEMER